MKENCGKYVIGKIQKKTLHSEPGPKIHRNKNNRQIVVKIIDCTTWHRVQ